MKKLKYKKVLLKLSGEAFLGKREYGIDPEFTRDIAKQIKKIKELGIEICIVIGGGNIFRGISASEHGLDRATGDYIGMLATVMNALALQDALKKEGVEARVQSALVMNGIAEPYIREKAASHLKKERVVIFAAGIGNPFFTTDMAAALRALEMKCDVLLKATKVDGVYDKDPIKFKDSKKYKRLKHKEVLENGLSIMDSSAIALCMDNSIPIIVFNLLERGNIIKAIRGEYIGTVVE
ncbi:MAG: UMP kinase [Patescibacteria group bacterium]|nr:UMP kinase [Patescibacteria group bacterium]MCL5093623.1 UMP kinase [Patescibacteria group bacterium]